LAIIIIIWYHTPPTTTTTTTTTKLSSGFLFFGGKKEEKKKKKIGGRGERGRGLRGPGQTTTTTFPPLFVVFSKTDRIPLLLLFQNISIIIIFCLHHFQLLFFLGISNLRIFLQFRLYPYDFHHNIILAISIIIFILFPLFTYL
jgi:hypothetical protein